MPHFIIDCSKEILIENSSIEIIDTVYDAAVSTGLFDKSVVKTRIQPYDLWRVGDEKTPFVHVFGNIMQGRNSKQKADLSMAIVSSLKALLPEVPVISMSIRDFEKDSYCNRDMID